MTSTWVTNDDDTLRCTACGVESFVPGDSCNCPAGAPDDSPERRNSEATGALADDLDEDEVDPTASPDDCKELSNLLPAQPRAGDYEAAMRRVVKRRAGLEHKMRRANNDRTAGKLRGANLILTELRKDIVSAAQLGERRLATEETLIKERTARGLALLKQGRTEEAARVLGLEAEGSVH